MIFKLLSEKIKLDCESDQNFANSFKDNFPLFNQLTIGRGFYSVFNGNTLEFDLVSNGVKDLTGYESSFFCFALVEENIHPEDKIYLSGFSTKIADFFSGFPAEKLMKYKVSYDYRFKVKNGYYIRLLHQSSFLLQNESHKLCRTINIQTDISHLKKDGKPSLSIIGFGSEPTFINIEIDENVLETTGQLSPREREILVLLSQGKLSKDISHILHISKHTVDNHRKRMLTKCNTKTMSELMGKAIKAGWI